MIELRVKWFQSNGSVMHIALTPVCHRMCMDVEVVRALGMNICRNCIINSQDPCTCDEEKYPHPDPKAVQRFLECGRLIGSDSIYRHRYGCYHRLHILKVRVYSQDLFGAISPFSSSFSLNIKD